MRGNLTDASYCIDDADKKFNEYTKEDTPLNKICDLSCVIGSVAEAIRYLQKEKRDLNRLYKNHERLL